ncbi:MAG: methylenetetrahydrofolate reductase [NAD(P)H] [Elusimicrobia bacterium]|nr:methylenetetrahydrofolate reductase [NAD(P)H] [Elusimicrobiota bacterium]
MRVIEFYKQNKEPVFSFEFFLPKTPEAKDGFLKTLAEVKALAPHFVTLTYGAAGSSRQSTVEMAGLLKNKYGFETVMHLTSIAHTRSDIDGILAQARKLNIENIMALRGDLPKDGPVVALEQRDFKYATDLVRHLRQNNNWCIGVAGYPEGHTEAVSRQQDILRLKEKVDAGADYIATQLFFDNRDYFRFVDEARAAGILAPIVPGIMPITNFHQIQKFAAMCGAKIPADLSDRLSRVHDDAQAVVNIGIEHAAHQCADLLAKGVPGIHFYTLNRARSAQEILSRIKRL